MNTRAAERTWRRRNAQERKEGEGTGGRRVPGAAAAFHRSTGDCFHIKVTHRQAGTF